MMKQWDLFEKDESLSQRDLFLDNETWENIEIWWAREEIKTKILSLLHNDYSIYKIDTLWDKISHIYFKYKNHSFKISLDYTYTQEKLVHRNYYETDPDERETYYTKTIFLNIKIPLIQKKASVWYDIWKKSINYFKYLGLNYRDVISFVEKTLKEYHNN